MLKGRPRTVRLARELRRAMSLPEVMLWQVLCARPNGLKFRRQHPADAYVIDSFNAEARLAVEVDGAAHRSGDRQAKDAGREAWLAAQHIATLRIPASLVLADIDDVLEIIVASCRARLALHQPAAGPPPRSGEE